MANAALLERLSSEVLGIVSSPFPISLKTLHDILSLDRDGFLMNQFTVGHPYELKLLVPCVVDILESRTFAIDLLERLCLDELFRAELLESNPGLLDSLLVKASAGHEAYTKLCIQLLSQPLPGCIALPASVDTFFLSIVREAVRNPTSSSLSACYGLLSGACRALPGLLPKDDWLHLEGDLAEIVRSSKTLGDQSLGLICLGIINILAKCQHKSNDNGLEVGAVARTSVFFTLPKAFKTLNLAALQAVWVTKCLDDLGMQAVRTKFDLVLDVMGGLSNATIEEWSRSADGKSAISRVLAKCLDVQLDVVIRMKLFSILAFLCQSGHSKRSLIPYFETFIQDSAYLKADTAWFRSAMGASFSILGNELHSTTWRYLLQLITRATSTTADFSATELENLSSQITHMHSMINENQSMARHTVSSLDAIDLRSLCSQFGLLESHGEPIDQKKYELSRQASSLWLAALIISPGEGSDTLSKLSLCLLQHIQSRENDRFERHTDYVKPKTTSISIDPYRLAQQNTHGSWREKIEAFAAQEQTLQQDRLVQVVRTICQDLEERCEVGEAPLRKAQAEIMDLQGRVRKLVSERDELEVQTVDISTRYERLETETTEVEDMLRSENERLVERVYALEQELSKTQDAAKSDLEHMVARYNSKEFEMQACLVQSEARIEEVTGLLEQAKASVQTQLSILAETKAQLSSVEKERENLHGELESCREGRNTLESAKKELIIVVHDLHQAQHTDSVVFSALQQEYDALQALSKRQLAAHNNEISNLRSEMAGEQERHKTVMTDLQKHAVEERCMADSRIGELSRQVQNEMANTEQLRHQAEELQSVISEQENQLVGLQNTIMSRDDEIAGFQAMRQTLAAAIGGLPDRKHSLKSVSYKPAVHNSSTVRRHSRRLLEKSTQSTPMQQDGEMLKTVGADLSFESISSRSGSTPKRAKPSNPFKLPMVRQPRLSAAATPRSVKRLPLIDVSKERGNVSPIRPSRFSKAAKTPRLQVECYNEEDYFGIGSTDGFWSETEMVTSTVPDKLVAPVNPVNHKDYEDDTLEE